MLRSRVLFTERFVFGDFDSSMLLSYIVKCIVLFLC